MARNSIFRSFVFLLLLSISLSLEDDDDKQFVSNHLKAFGYLSGDHTLVDDTYDEALVYALDTLMMTSRPRCNVLDHPLTDNIHNIKLQYTFFPGSPKWTEMKLKYIFITSTPIGSRTISKAVKSTFSTWSAASSFTFRKVLNFSKWPQIQIGFYSGEHGDEKPFTGRDGEYAHACSPPGGKLHFNWDQAWGTVQHDNILDIESVALHEIGHLLGIHHSNDRDAVMFPTFRYGQIRRHLHQDDIDGIHALYAQ